MRPLAEEQTADRLIAATSIAALLAIAAATIAALVIASPACICHITTHHEPVSWHTQLSVAKCQAWCLHFSIVSVIGQAGKPSSVYQE